MTAPARSDETTQMGSVAQARALPGASTAAAPTAAPLRHQGPIYLPEHHASAVPASPACEPSRAPATAPPAHDGTPSPSPRARRTHSRLAVHTNERAVYGAHAVAQAADADTMQALYAIHSDVVHRALRHLQATILAAVQRAAHRAELARLVAQLDALVSGFGALRRA